MLVCNSRDAQLYELQNRHRNLADKDPVCRFKSTDIIHIDYCRGIQQIHIELKCRENHDRDAPVGMEYARDVFIDMAHDRHTDKFFKKLLIKDDLGLVYLAISV
ncbi:MAG: hypothetical protein Q9225_003016 [Loekoesia sp. 1 TL-2023]